MSEHLLGTLRKLRSLKARRKRTIPPIAPKKDYTPPICARKRPYPAMYNDDYYNPDYILEWIPDIKCWFITKVAVGETKVMDEQDLTGDFLKIEKFFKFSKNNPYKRIAITKTK